MKIEKETFVNKKFKTFGKYKFSRKLFRVYMVLVLVLGIFAAADFWVTGSDHYLVCSSASPCVNPFYDNCPSKLSDKSICEREFLPAGFESGAMPGFFYQTFSSMVWILFIVMLFINHYKYNRGEIK